MQFGASKDSQTAADTKALSGGWAEGAAEGGRGAMQRLAAMQQPCPGQPPRAVLAAGNASTGAATYCFIQAIERRGTKLS